MTAQIPLGLARLTFAPTLPDPAQALLTNGRVLAYGVGLAMPASDDPNPCPSPRDGVGVCVPTPSGPCWLWGWKDILDRGDRDLAMAIVSLTQPFAIPLEKVGDIWTGIDSPQAPDLHTSSAAVDLIITPHGLWLELQWSNGEDIYDAIAPANREFQAPNPDGTAILATLPLAGLFCLLAPEAPSAHAALAQAGEMEALFEQVCLLASSEGPITALLAAARPFLRPPSGEEIQALCA